MYYSVGSAIKNIGLSSASSLRSQESLTCTEDLLFLGTVHSDERGDAAHPVGISILME